MTENPSSPDRGPEAADPDNKAKMDDVNRRIKDASRVLYKLRSERSKIVTKKPFDWGKDLKEDQEFEKPPGKHTRWSFCGVDTEALLVSPERGDQPRIINPAPFVQGISWGNTDWNIGGYVGTILSIVNEESMWPHLPIKLGGIVLQSIDEYGVDAWLVIRNVDIIQRGGGVSIDDITTEDNYTYHAEDVVGWIKGRGYHKVYQHNKGQTYNLKKGEYTFSKEVIEALTGEPLEEDHHMVRVVES